MSDKSEVELFLEEIDEFLAKAETIDTKDFVGPKAKLSVSEQNAYALEALSSGYRMMANILAGSARTKTDHADVSQYTLIGDVLQLTATAISDGNLSEVVTKLKEN